jgi:hypothetical protein
VDRSSSHQTQKNEEGIAEEEGHDCLFYYRRRLNLETWKTIKHEVINMREIEGCVSNENLATNNKK